MSISDLNIQTTLLDLGYNPTSNKTSIIFANVIDGVFFGFGSTIQNGLINEAKKQNLPKHFKFPYYSLVEKSIIDFLGQVGGKKILAEINAELSRQTGITGSTEDILNELSKREILQRIQDFSGHEHAIFLWKNKELRDKLLTHYFESSKGPKRAISSEELSIPDVDWITYEEIFSDKSKSTEKNLQSIVDTHEKNNSIISTRVAGFDATQWFKHGLTEEFLEVEKNAQQYIETNLISGICSYDINQIPDEQTLKSFLDCHPLVLLDDPFVIYERGN